MAKKKYLTGWVHALIDGHTVSVGPGDEAPEWVTNESVLTDGPDATPDPEPESSGDELDGMSIKDLRALAKELGLAGSGSKGELTDRIRAKQSETTEDVDSDLAALIEKARDLGYDADESMSEVELQALIDAAR